MNTYWLSNLGMDLFEAPSTLPQDADVVVIGGGLMGVASAYWLARAGQSVLLLESEGLCGGATGRNAGLMLPSSSALEDPRLLREVLADEEIDAGYSTPGHLALASSEACWDAYQAEAASAQERGGSLQALDLKSCENLIGMRLSNLFFGGRWFPQGGVVHSARMVYGLARAAERHGARVAVQTPAQEVTTMVGTDRLAVATPRGRVETRYVVYACNYRLVDLVPELAGMLTPKAAQMLSTEPLQPLFQIGFGVDWGSVYWRQASDGAIVLGGGSRSWEGDGKSGDGLDRETQGRLESFPSRAFLDFPQLAVSRRWTGVMDDTLDGRPLVGPLPSDRRRWVVAGFGGHGMPAGLHVGKGIADGITTGQISGPMAALMPSRFEGITGSTC